MAVSAAFADSTPSSSRAVFCASDSVCIPISSSCLRVAWISLPSLSLHARYSAIRCSFTPIISRARAYAPSACACWVCSAARRSSSWCMDACMPCVAASASLTSAVASSILCSVSRWLAAFVSSARLNA